MQLTGCVINVLLVAMIPSGMLGDCMREEGGIELGISGANGQRLKDSHPNASHSRHPCMLYSNQYINNRDAYLPPPFFLFRSYYLLKPYRRSYFIILIISFRSTAAVIALFNIPADLELIRYYIFKLFKTIILSTA